MKRLLQNMPHSDGDYAYIPVMRQGAIKPAFKQRLLNWILRVEPAAESYEDYGAYGAQSATCAGEAPRVKAGVPGQPSYGSENAWHTGVQQALREWKAATAYFESVSDPELVDYAVYEMEAAQKRYIFLLHSAKNAASRRVT